ncbi:MAG TPA: putative cytokinetic ring protein SteA [Acidimicrobiales bacterium]|nr:putative cytokinetic ring protein SteA [Acidimicrobiales bacterium]
MLARDEAEATVGPARVDRRTKDLIKRLHPGDVAVIDHEDLDRIAAEGIVEARAGAVVNAASSLSGRYPNVGPLLVAAAGIPLVDGVGPDVMDRIAEGEWVRVEGGDVVVEGRRVATGTRQTLQSLEHAYEQAKGNMGEELERFAENTLEYLRRERHLILDTPHLPEIRTTIRGRQVLIVVRGLDYKEDLAHLRRTGYVGEMRPVLIGVDGGADALLESGLKPDIIIGDFDSVSTKALDCGAELVVHAYPGGGAPGAERLREGDRPFSLFEAGGTSEDIAMLLAYELGAELIVAVGTHASMVEFLDKGRAGMASTFLVRLKVGPILVDAKGVSRLYHTRLRTRDLVLFLVAAFVTFAVIVAVAFPSVFIQSAWVVVRDLWGSVFG